MATDVEHYGGETVNPQFKERMGLNLKSHRASIAVRLNVLL
jgi:hypothetical protein